MFHEVRVLNADGTTKEIVSPKKLSLNHWDNFQQMEDRIGLTQTGQKPVPPWVKKKLDVVFADIHYGMN
jgi:hypothetical protein